MKNIVYLMIIVLFASSAYSGCLYYDSSNEICSEVENSYECWNMNGYKALFDVQGYAGDPCVTGAYQDLSLASDGFGDVMVTIDDATWDECYNMVSVAPMENFELIEGACSGTPPTSCTQPGTTNWVIQCTDNCVFTVPKNIPGNLSFIYTGVINFNTNFRFTSTNQYIFINPSCQININSGGGFY